MENKDLHLKENTTGFPMLPGLETASQSIPAPGSCRDETINGMAVLVPDMEDARERLHKTAKSN